MKSESYKKGTCCRADCNFESNSPDEPCWGQVIVVDEEYSEDDYWWIHACEGHINTCNHGKYIKETQS